MIEVSVCMIVKNESAVLKRCLDSLNGLYDELIIVDTGSTDDTKEIASLYTDKIYELEWIDDFSYARNFAFSKCTKDYIYSVDADEVLDEVNRNRFLDIKENLLPEIEIVQMWYVNTNEFSTTENFQKELRPKLYKRLREFKWIDPIHETVNTMPVVFDSDIEILHMPVSNHGTRDFGIFRKTIEKGITLSDKLVMMYARELMIAGTKDDFLKAADYFLMLLYDLNRNDEIRNYSYCILAKTNRLLGNDSDFFKWALKNICIEPCSEICVEMGIYYYDREDYQEAIIWFINALSETKPVLSLSSSEEEPKRWLVKCYEKLAEEDELMRDIYLEEIKKYQNNG